MMLSDKLRFLRETMNLPQRKIAAALDIDTATYCKFEKGTLRPKREQIDTLSILLNADKDDLIKLWLADKVCDVVKDEAAAKDVLLLAVQNISDSTSKE